MSSSWRAAKPARGSLTWGLEGEAGYLFYVVDGRRMILMPPDELPAYIADQVDS